jgi:hypothetical protein
MSMADEPEIRVGDLQAAQATRTKERARAGALDAQVFPTLAEFVGAADFRKRLDELAGLAREAKEPEVRSALQTAVRLLPILRGKFGG